MRIIEKLMKKSADHPSHEGVTIAFFGDSVTQGCFELYRTECGGVETVFDQRSAYCHGVADILSLLYPRVPINVINAGISGDRSSQALARLERDVLRHAPDLTVVCFGLNECGRDASSVTTYVQSLSRIFDRLQAAGSEVIYMTPNMKNTRISAGLLSHEMIDRMAEYGMGVQNDGTFDAHIDAAKRMCRERSVPICDCYAIWKRLAACGVDTTDLLANKLNHPIRDMHRLFAYELVKTMFDMK